MYKIPANPTWCRVCHHTGHWCVDHGGAEGPRPYAGPNVYEPSEWVKETVGGTFSFWPDYYMCDGYDPREGFWMLNIQDPVDRRNVSERAIGHTFHRRLEDNHTLRLIRAAHALLGAYIEADYAPGFDGWKLRIRPTSERPLLEWSMLPGNLVRAHDVGLLQETLVELGFTLRTSP